MGIGGAIDVEGVSGTAGVASGKDGKFRKSKASDGAGSVPFRVDCGSGKFKGRAANSAGLPGGVPDPDFSTKVIRSEKSSRERTVCRPSGMRDIWLTFRFLILDFSRTFVFPRLSITVTASVVSEWTIPA